MSNEGGNVFQQNIKIILRLASTLLYAPFYEVHFFYYLSIISTLYRLLNPFHCKGTVYRHRKTTAMNWQRNFKLYILETL